MIGIVFVMIYVNILFISSFYIFLIDLLFKLFIFFWLLIYVLTSLLNSITLVNLFI